MILGLIRKEKKQTLPYVLVHTERVCCDINLLWFNREVLVLDTRQQHNTGSSHTVHCDLCSAHNCASSSIQTGHVTARRPVFRQGT